MRKAFSLLSAALVVLCLIDTTSAFLLPVGGSGSSSRRVTPSPTTTTTTTTPRSPLPPLHAVEMNDGDEENEEIVPGKMKVSEIKAELDLRGISYVGIMERNELEGLLLDARVKGKARPEILETFNQQREEEAKRTAGGQTAPDFDVDSMKAGDGSLPGGVDAEAVKALTSDAEMMEIMSNPKLQELMKLVMEGKQAEVETYMADAEILQLMARFQELANKAGLSPEMFSGGAPGGPGPYT